MDQGVPRKKLLNPQASNVVRLEISAIVIVWQWLFSMPVFPPNESQSQAVVLVAASYLSE